PYYYRVALPRSPSSASLIFFLNATPTTEIYTLSLHDALPISRCPCASPGEPPGRPWSASADSPAPAGQSTPRHIRPARGSGPWSDRKSTRLNSSHVKISYAVFCLKKKKKKE